MQISKVISYLLMASCVSSFLCAEDGDKTPPSSQEPIKTPPFRPTVKAKKVEFPQETLQWQKEIQEQLQQRISFDFVDTPLADVVAFLVNKTKVNIILDPAAVEGDDVPVTLKVTDMKLKAAIEWVLRLVSRSNSFRNGALFISTQDRIGSRVVNRVFDCRDILSVEAETDFLETLQSMTPGAEWETGETMLRFIDGRIIIRNKKSVVDKLEGFVGKFIETSGGPKYTPWIDKE
jgi:hypothetical protein